MNNHNKNYHRYLQIIHKPGSAEWGLRITDVQPKDAGNE